MDNIALASLVKTIHPVLRSLVKSEVFVKDTFKKGSVYRFDDIITYRIDDHFGINLKQHNLVMENG